jgi:AcrR family transcriptional regulator
MAGEETRRRILIAAEQLFAERGISSTSLRALTRAAGVNLAAVNYHFGSKEALLDAVIEFRATPMNVARIDALDAHTTERGDEPLEVDCIFPAFLMPAVCSVIESPEGAAHLPRLFARLEAQPPEVLEAIYRRHLGDVTRRFVEALQQSLPDLPKELIAERFRLAMGSIFTLFSGNSELDFVPGHSPQVVSIEEKLESVITFVTGGISAPASARRAPGQRVEENTQ